MAWRDNKEFVAVARNRWRKDMGKCVDSDAGASQRMARRFEGWIAAKVEAGASPRDLYAPDVEPLDCGSIAKALDDAAIIISQYESQQTATWGRNNSYGDRIHAAKEAVEKAASMLRGKESGSVTLKREDASAIRVLLSRLAAGIATSGPDTTRLAEVLADELERQLRATEQQSND